MSCKNYRKNPAYNNQYIVQLLDNYRSHPAILQFSNEQFYDESLRPKMPLSEQNLTETWNILSNKKFPISFHSVKTECKIGGTSSYNEGEIDVVKLYVEKLLTLKLGSEKVVQNDIGIITPYIAQLKILKDEIKRAWPGIEMGTAEYFRIG